MKTHFRTLFFLGLLANANLLFSQPSPLGIFSDQADIGSVAKAGSASFDPAKGEYLIMGGGANMWATNDAFHFVWKKMSGDFALTANVSFIGTNGSPHRKACLVIRQTLDADSPYADAALHGVGLTSLQFRETPGGLTHEIQASISAPGKLRLEKRGDYLTMSVAMPGEETRLTTAKGLDDGPDYSPDGKYIYFNSERSGLMQIWRMKPDGSEQEQVTSDDYNNWFAHPSPDGRWIVFISFTKEVSPNAHPANKDVMLRLMSLADGKIQVLAKLFGGQGTINVPSWSPDSKQVAFVSYQRVYP